MTPSLSNDLLRLWNITDLLFNSSSTFENSEDFFRHVINGGLQLAVHITILFNSMLKHAFVPSDFCGGIIVGCRYAIFM